MLTAKYWGNAINSIYYMQLFIIIATLFLYKALSRKKPPFIKALFFTFSTPPPLQKKKQHITELQKLSISPDEKVCNGEKFSVNELLIVIFSSDSCKE